MIRQFFGWFFVFVAACVVVFAALHFRDLLIGRARSRITAVVPVVFLGAVVYVFTMTWWSTWTDKRGARLWGIAASLIGIAVSCAHVALRHQPMAKTTWQILAASAFALIAYAWPDSEPESEVSEQIKD